MKYLCIHGHFYQPPRENPGLESIEPQDSAHPYHDWNERIKAECYAPNSAARILADDGQIARIVNNYSLISFNFGPTLLTWLAEKDRELYQRIIAADGESREHFSGHGSAMAQAYNHVILPLASSRDKRIQIRWGIRDFEFRFGRQPEGMWLPETAVDLESLDLMAEQGIKFTVLAPHQVARVRPVGATNWKAVPDASVDTTRAYRVQLPSGRSIAVFFYNGPLARAVAFEDLLKDGQALADALLASFRTTDNGPQLAHIATDGETFGHHHKYGDMALAYALDRIAADDSVQITNYGEFLMLHPPEWEAEIVERTAWSCAHGAGRWYTDCGCNSGGHPGFNQRWRAPLREALDFLRDQLLKLYRKYATQLFSDPERVFEDYVQVILDRDPQHAAAFLNQYASHPLSEDERIKALKLLEIQRNAQLMYTSCGWFFDDISGIETVQLLHYAGRALQLAAEFTSDDLEAKFTSMLLASRSNIAKYGDGRELFRRFVRPGRVDLARVAANAALTRLLADDEEPLLHCYAIQRSDSSTFKNDRARLVAGQFAVTSRITSTSTTFYCIALHPGNHHAVCSVEPGANKLSHQETVERVAHYFQRGDFEAAAERLKAVTETGRIYGIDSLFGDEQRALVRYLTDAGMAEAKDAYRKLYHDHTALMDYLSEMNVPIPRPFKVAAEMVVQAELEALLQATPINRDRIGILLGQVELWDLKIDSAALAFCLATPIEDAANQLKALPHQPDGVFRLLELVELRNETGLEANIWHAQNVFYELLQTTYASAEASKAGVQESLAWGDMISRLGDQLDVRVQSAE